MYKRNKNKNKNKKFIKITRFLYRIYHSLNMVFQNLYSIGKIKIKLWLLVLYLNIIMIILVLGYPLS